MLPAAWPLVGDRRVVLRIRRDPVAVLNWYLRLAVVARDGVRGGEWRLLDATGWPDNQSCRNLVTWYWSGDGDTRHAVVINLSGQPAQGTVSLKWPGWPRLALD